MAHCLAIFDTPSTLTSLMSESILAQHPDPGKQGVNINRKKYDVIYDAINTYLHETGTASLKEITHAVKESVGNSFDGSVGWYVTTVKLDMESRGALICDRSKSPHQHYLK